MGLPVMLYMYKIVHLAQPQLLSKFFVLILFLREFCPHSTSKSDYQDYFEKLTNNILVHHKSDGAKTGKL